MEDFDVIFSLTFWTNATARLLCTQIRSIDPLGMVLIA